MEMICPECMGTLVAQDAESVRCTIHGGQFKVLFTRWQPPVTRSSSPPPILAENATCVQHPNIPAVHACQSCGTPLCATCAFESGGSWYCPKCVTQPMVSARGESGFTAPSAGISLTNVRCVQHPSIQATQQCKVCGAFMCATCDFTLPGGIHVCPTCATAPKTNLSPRRKKLLIGSFALAAWSTVGMVAVFAGAFAGMARDKAGEQVLGTLMMLFVLGPAIVGTALGVGAMDRRLATPPLLWIATIWNAIILASFVLLMIIGMAKG